MLVPRTKTTIGGAAATMANDLKEGQKTAKFWLGPIWRNAVTYGWGGPSFFRGLTGHIGPRSSSPMRGVRPLPRDGRTGELCRTTHPLRLCTAQTTYTNRIDNA